MQQSARPTFTSEQEQIERHISPTNKIAVQSVSGAIKNDNKRQNESIGECDQDEEVYEDNGTESSRTQEKRKVSRRELDERTPQSLSNTTQYAAHTVDKEFQPSTMHQERPIRISATMNEKRLKNHAMRKHPKESTQIASAGRNMDQIYLRVDIPQSIRPNSTGVINVSDEMGVRKTIAVTMEKSDQKGDSNAADEITISVDPLGLEGLFTEEIERNQDNGIIHARVKEKVPHYLNKVNPKLKSYGRAQNNRTNPKPKAASYLRPGASDETPVVESGFNANESSADQVGVESQKALSPLTPLSCSGLNDTSIAESNPVVEEPLSPPAPSDSETMTSDDGTQYYISESDCEIDQAVQGGLLNTFAQSVWGMFSAPSTDET